MRAWLRLVCALVLTIVGSIHTSIGASLRPGDERLAYRMKRQGMAARLFCRVLNIHVKASSEARLAPGVLRVSNHLTAIDPIFLASKLDVCFAGKAEITRWPIVGWICRTYAMLLVDRSRKGRAKAFASQVRTRLMERGSVMVFPEGTTGDGKALLPFKTGAFESIRDWDEGRVQPIFVNVIGLDGRAMQGSEGREKVSNVHHDTFVGHVHYLAGFKRLDIELRIGPFIETQGMDRKVISKVVKKAILTLAETIPATHSSGHNAGY